MQIRMKYLLMHWSQRWIQTEWIYNTNIPCKFQQSHDQRLDRQTKAIIQTEILLQFPHNAEWLLSYLHSNFSDTFFPSTSFVALLAFHFDREKKNENKSTHFIICIFQRQ